MDHTPSGNDHPQGDVADANATAPIPVGTSTPKAITMATTSCASNRLPLPVDIEDEDMFNKNEELSIKHNQPPQPSKKMLWTWEHFIKIPSNCANPQVRYHHCRQLCGCHLNKQGTSAVC